MEDLTKYRGVLKGFDLGFLEDDLLLFLIDTNLLVLDQKDDTPIYEIDLNEFNTYYTLIENITKGKIKYNGSIYSLNSIIINDIFEIINSKIISTPINFFNQKIDARIDDFEKINFLKKQHKKITSKIKNYEKFVLYSDYENNLSSTWKDYFFNEIIKSKPTISKYLIENRIDFEDYSRQSNSVINYVFYKNENTLFEKDHPLIIRLIEYFISKKQLDYISDELDNLQESSEKYNLENVKSEYNRGKNVFKDAYYCEFFIYLFTEIDDLKPIHLSYFFEIFENEGNLVKDLKHKYYFNFCQKYFGLNETRIRPSVSNSEFNQHCDFYKKCKIEFDLKTQ